MLRAFQNIPPAPPVTTTISPTSVHAYDNQVVDFYGSGYTPDTTITHASVQITNITYISETHMQATVTRTTTGGTYLNISNANGAHTKYLTIIAERVSTWKDLRSGGDAVTWTSRDGKGTTIASPPTAAGTTLQGGIFSSAINISSHQWNRSTPTKVSVITVNDGSHHIVGIGSPSMGANSAQYNQLEIGIWVNVSKMASCFGNNGTLGTVVSTPVPTDILKVGTHMKYVFTDNGSVGSALEIWTINATTDDWRHGGTLLRSIPIGASMTADEPILEIAFAVGSAVPTVVGIEIQTI